MTVFDSDDLANNFKDIYKANFNGVLSSAKFVVSPEASDKVELNGNNLKLKKQLKDDELNAKISLVASYTFCDSKEVKNDFIVKFKNPVSVETTNGEIHEKIDRSESVKDLKEMLSMYHFKKVIMKQGETAGEYAKVIGRNPIFKFYDLEGMDDIAKGLLRKNQVKISGENLVYIPDSNPNAPALQREAKFRIKVSVEYGQNNMYATVPRDFVMTLKPIR